MMLLGPGSGQQDAILDWTRQRVGDSQRPPVYVSLQCVSKDDCASCRATDGSETRMEAGSKPGAGSRELGAGSWELLGSVLGSWMMDARPLPVKKGPAPRGHWKWLGCCPGGLLGCWGTGPWGTRVWGDALESRDGSRVHRMTLTAADDQMEWRVVRTIDPLPCWSWRNWSLPRVHGCMTRFKNSCSEEQPVTVPSHNTNSDGRQKTTDHGLK